MGISYEKEGKIKSKIQGIFGSIVSVVSVVLLADWQTLQTDPVSLAALIASFFGITITATAPSVTKKQ